MTDRPLTLNLVPSSCWGSNLRSELPKSEWERLRRRTYKEHDYTCQICGGVGRNHPVECHEQWEYDEETKTQILKSLLSLCPSCHEVKHFGFATTRGRQNEALAHYQRVNNVGRNDAISEVQQEFRVWEERSSKNWKLDVSLLLKLECSPEQVGIMMAKRHAAILQAEA